MGKNQQQNDAVKAAETIRKKCRCNGRVFHSYYYIRNNYAEICSILLAEVYSEEKLLLFMSKEKFQIIIDEESWNCRKQLQELNFRLAEYIAIIEIYVLSKGTTRGGSIICGNKQLISATASYMLLPEDTLNKHMHLSTSDIEQRFLIPQKAFLDRL